MKKNYLILLVAIFFFGSQAALALAPAVVKEWRIVPDQSKIEFAVTQDKSQITGAFKNFSGEIFFDQTRLKDSKVKIEIDLNSFNLSFADALPTAKNKDWFDVKAFPKATFSAKKFSKISAEKFRAEGTLNLKGKELPLAFDFNFKENSAKKSVVVAEFPLVRSVFGVGAKDEKFANGVKDEVTVKFLLTATAQ